MRPRSRLVLAFLLAPVAPLLLASIVYPFTVESTVWSGQALLYAVCAYPVWLAFGIPLYQFVTHKGWLRWWQLILQGCLLGVIALPILPMGLLLATGSSFRGVGSGRLGMEVLILLGERDWLQIVGHALFLGAISGAIFALVLLMPIRSPQAKAS